ncbi:ABC transporter ATP-binding protein/permease ['Crotalaria aegyptiaca' phytoplasma]|uniref:ABC transporter ATP-binding protein/permease n=1 Tax=Candidatus Phytoplasma crotalariae TaxID=2982627 RepID=A0ABT9D272_9MOLU|nr:ABC transporter ATP-binding protein/permease ['Crotalaria aegyptiaca' phytoplasma]MDO8059127.1 ABC transporter ATP-binding protein/permease ['Crotalaria aegyptiaca' phytoplasma]
MLICKKINKFFKLKKDLIFALKDINISLPLKGLVFIVGKSGSGKTTLMNILGGLEKISDGDIMFNHKSFRNFSESDFDNYRNQSVGFIFQHFNLIDDLTVSQNISIALELQGKKVNDKNINNLLHEVDLAGFGSRHVNELSGGQKQRVAIARAMIKEPDFLIADEPTGALDSVTGEQILKLFSRIAKQKLIILVSHNLEMAHKYADRIIELQDGQIIKDQIKKSNNFFTDISYFDINNKELINSKIYLCKKKNSKFFSKLSFRMAWNNIKNKPISLFFNILLTTSFFALLGFFSVMYFFKSSYTIKSMFQNHPEKNFVFSKNFDFNRYFNKFSTMSSMTLDEFNLLKQKNPKVHLQPMISFEFFNEIVDLIETSENEKFWSAIGYHKPLNFNKNKIYISRNVYEFLQSYKKSPDFQYISHDLELLLSLLKEKLAESIVIEMIDDQYIPRIKYYNNLNQDYQKSQLKGETSFLNSIKIAFLELYYSVEKYFGNQNVVLLPKEVINKFITPDFMKKGYNENQTLKFCKIIGCLQDLSKKEINDFVDNYYHLYKIKNQDFTISISQTPFINLFNFLETDLKKSILLFIVIVSVVLAIFAGIMIIIFTNNSIKLRYKDIGILRAIGAGKMYILSIFLIEMVIFFLINLSLALILIKFFLFKINSWFISYLSVPFLMSNLKTYICVFVLGLIFYILVTFIQIIKITIKKPIDIINSR